MKAKIMKAGRGAWGRIGLGNKAGMEMVQSALFPLIFNDFQTCSTVMARRFLCVLVNKFPCLRDRLIGSGSVIVQVAILIALAIALGVIFKSEITQFVNDVFSKLKA